jgi:Mce-associated membrane protein
VRDRSWRSRLAGLRWGLVLAALVPVAAALALWLWQHDRLGDLEAAEADDRRALDAATRVTLAWATIDHTKADEYIATVQDGATGTFLSEFTEAEETLRALLEDNESVQVPTIPKDGAGLLEHKEGSDTATVLVAMDASVSNKDTEEPQPRQYRLRVTMTEVDGEWLVSNMEFIDAEA